MNEVLEFWFADPSRWWVKDPSFDALIRERFATVHGEIMKGEHEAWRETAKGALAYVIVLDQFSRNMFRDTAGMFASDAQARTATTAALAAGHDRELSTDERSFLYMPYMHAEDLALQVRAVELFGTLAPKSAEFAEKHRVIVARFGRFPHRNQLLGRASTAEELEFLTQPGSSF